MGRPRNPERDKSMQRYLDAYGKIETAELAKLAGVPEVRIRKSERSGITVVVPDFLHWRHILIKKDML